MDCLPCSHTHKNDIEFLKQVRDNSSLTSLSTSYLSQLYARLSTETYFGIKEFTLGYYIAEMLSEQSLRY